MPADTAVACPGPVIAGRYRCRYLCRPLDFGADIVVHSTTKSRRAWRLESQGAPYSVLGALRGVSILGVFIVVDGRSPLYVFA